MNNRNPTRVLLVLLMFTGRAVAGQVVAAVEEVTLTVSNADRSLAFYRDVLGCVPLGDSTTTNDANARLLGVPGPVRVVRMSLGQERLALLHFPAMPGRPIPSSQRSNDGGFQHIAIVVRDLEAAYRWLQQKHIRAVSAGPQTLPKWNPTAGGIRAFYFSGPDRHTLELIWFPPGKGDPKWQSQKDRSDVQSPGDQFLGIDHRAIGVGDTDASLALYRDRLGLRIVGRSENFGIEQERLNGVPGAHLRITTLRAGQGPGIELLEYLEPRDGRPAPQDLAANDILHWQTSLRVRDVGEALGRARNGGARVISQGAVTLPPSPLGGGTAALVRDGDAHALLLIEGGGTK